MAEKGISLINFHGVILHNVIISMASYSDTNVEKSAILLLKIE
jgi:hypothetical protein